jgi:hypothetical protein
MHLVHVDSSKPWDPCVRPARWDTLVDKYLTCIRADRSEAGNEFRDQNTNHSRSASLSTLTRCTDHAPTFNAIVDSLPTGSHSVTTQQCNHDQQPLGRTGWSRLTNVVTGVVQLSMLQRQEKNYGGLLENFPSSKTFAIQNEHHSFQSTVTKPFICYE